MKLSNFTQLQQQLEKNLASLYLISGDESLLVEEALDAVRHKAKQQGFLNRAVFYVESRFNWQNVLLEANSLSLFSDKKLVELRFRQGKFSKEDKAALEQLLGLLNPDLLLLISLPKLESGVNKLKFYKQLEESGQTLIIWPVDRNKLPAFIRERLARYRLSAEDEAIELLADSTEGNLLATAQTIEKLYLLADRQIDVSLMASVVNDASRYSVFDFVDRLLQGDLAKILKCLHGLEAEDTEPSIIIWAVSKDIRLLYKLRCAYEQGASLAQAIRSEYILPMRQSLVERAVSRLTSRQLLAMLHKAQLVDQAIKGIKKESPWLHLEQLALMFSSKKLK